MVVRKKVAKRAGAKKAGASGMAAGSMFIYQRPHNAVLISYPSNYFYH